MKAIQYKWGCDSGKGFFKVVLQLIHGLEFKDSVKCCFIVAITDAPETRYNLRKIFSLLNEVDLMQENQTFTSDLKVVNLMVGLKSGSAKYSCPYCTNCRTTEHEGFQRDYFHSLSMYDQLQNEYNPFLVGSTKKGI